MGVAAQSVRLAFAGLLIASGASAQAGVDTIDRRLRAAIAAELAREAGGNPPPMPPAAPDQSFRLELRPEPADAAIGAARWTYGRQSLGLSLEGEADVLGDGQVVRTFHVLSVDIPGENGVRAEGRLLAALGPIFLEGPPFSYRVLMAEDEARQLAEHARFVILGRTVNPPRFFEPCSRHPAPATSQASVELSCNVTVEITKIDLVDSRDGRNLMSWRPGLFH